MKHSEARPNSETLQDISDSKAFVVTGEKCLQTNVAAPPPTTTASLVIPVRKSNGSAIPGNVRKHEIIKTAFPIAGLDNFNPLEGHTIRKDSPEGHTCALIYRRGGLS
jgi:hypothetical protein